MTTRGRRFSRTAIALGAGACVLACSPGARADRAYWQTAIGPALRWLPASPRYATDGVQTPSGTVPGGDMGGVGSVVWGGGGIDIALAIADRWQIPLLGAGVYVPLGSYAGVTAERGGALVELRPGSGFAVDIPLPGFGVRVKRRRWMFTASVRTAVVLSSIAARVASGVDWIDAGRANATTFSVRAEATVCRRLDPTTRACLWLAPNVYEAGLGNGGSVALRWEFGP